MVSKFIWPQRLITIVAVGGFSIAAVSIYFILKRRAIKEEVSEPEATMSQIPETEKSEEKPTEIIPSEVEQKQDTNDKTIEDKIEELKVNEETAERVESEATRIAKLLENGPERIVDWAACSEESDTVESGAPNNNKEQRSTKADNTTVCQSAPQSNGVQMEKSSSNGSSQSEGSSRSQGSADERKNRMNNNNGISHSDYESGLLPMYEFEVPNTLVGLIIGIRGKTIKELCTRAEVRILIRPHHDAAKVDTHQICSIEGRRDDINKCLHMMRHRFPPNRFPDLNLKPVFPPPAPPPVYTSPDMMELALPVGAMFDVYVSALISTGHFFVQLPTHPTFPSLRLVDDIMNRIYNHSLDLPECVRPPKKAKNMLCAAPASNGWYRALAVCYDEKQDEMLVKFVDYGGFARIPRADLRFLLRQDLLSLPFQSIECHIADVEPADGISWTEEANNYFQKVCTGKIIQCELVGHSRKDGFPVVRLYIKNSHGNAIPFYKFLLKQKLAKPWNPENCVGLQVPKITITKENVETKDSDTESIDSDATLVSPEPSEESKKENSGVPQAKDNFCNGKTNFSKKTSKQPRREVASYRS